MEPEARARIFERLEGLQLSRLEHVPGETGPTGGALFGMEFTDGTRAVVVATPDFSEGSQSPWKLAIAIVQDSNLIWSPATVAHFTKPRKETQGWLQEKVEGEVLENCRLLPELSPYGGEQALLKFKNTGAMLVRAAPPLKGGRHGYTSNIGIVWVPKEKLTVAVS